MVHPVIHLTKNYLLSAYYVPGSVLGTLGYIHGGKKKNIAKNLIIFDLSTYQR